MNADTFTYRVEIRNSGTPPALRWRDGFIVPVQTSKRRRRPLEVSTHGKLVGELIQTGDHF